MKQVALKPYLANVRLRSDAEVSFIVFVCSNCIASAIRAKKGAVMNRSVHVAAGLFDSRPYGFAQVAVIRTPFGDVVNVSGQVAWDADRKIVGAGDIGRQLEKSLENLAVALASVGATLNDVGSLRLYIKQGHMHESDAISGALKATFGENPPCATWIGVPSLANDAFLIEVEPSSVFLARK
jgi:enamine deaminase RidA (YjgF/YER057c/UK114 family)